MNIIIFLFIMSCVLSIHAQSSEVSYDELIELNVACGDLDSCQGNRNTEDLRVVNCHCDYTCSQTGTCCVDSQYKTKSADNVTERIVPAKLYGSNETVFMVNECRLGWNGDESIEDLCYIEDYEGYNDPFLLIPVSNPRTGIVYRNYYCFVCNAEDSSDTPVVWDFKLYANSDLTVGSFPDLRWQWGSFLVNDQFVYISVEPPQEVRSQVKWFRDDVIMTCNENWKDNATKEKCDAYMAMVYIQHESGIERFRNPHCAICNFKSVSDLICSEPNGYIGWGGPPSGYTFAGLFSLEDKVNKCPQNKVFDKFMKRCRTVRCGRNMEFVDGECVGDSTTPEPTTTPVSTEDLTTSVRRDLPDILETTLTTESTVTTRSTLPVQLDGFNWISGQENSTSKERPDLPKTPFPTEDPLTTQNLPVQPGGVDSVSNSNTSINTERPEPPDTTTPTESPITKQNLPVQPDNNWIPRWNTSVNTKLPEPFETTLPTEIPTTTLPVQPDIYNWITRWNTSIKTELPELPETTLTTETPITTQSTLPDQSDGFDWISDPSISTSPHSTELPETTSPTTTQNTVPVQPDDFNWTSGSNTSIRREGPELPETTLPTKPAITTQSTLPNQPDGFDWTSDPNTFVTINTSELPGTTLPTEILITTQSTLPDQPDGIDWLSNSRISTITEVPETTSTPENPITPLTELPGDFNRTSDPDPSIRLPETTFTTKRPKNNPNPTSIVPGGVWWTSTPKTSIRKERPELPTTTLTTKKPKNTRYPSPVQPNGFWWFCRHVFRGRGRHRTSYGWIVYRTKNAPDPFREIGDVSNAFYKIYVQFHSDFS